MRAVAIAALVLLAALSACKTASNRYADIEQAYYAQVAYIKQEVNAGRMTPVEGQARSKQALADANTQMEMRRAASNIRPY